MTNDDSAEYRLSKFSNADRRAYAHAQAGPGLQHPASFFIVENNPPLADLLEHAIRGSGLPERVRIDHSELHAFQRATEPKLLHERLIEELGARAAILRWIGENNIGDEARIKKLIESFHRDRKGLLRFLKEHPIFDGGIKLGEYAYD